MMWSESLREARQARDWGELAVLFGIFRTGAFNPCVTNSPDGQASYWSGIAGEERGRETKRKKGGERGRGGGQERGLEMWHTGVACLAQHNVLPSTLMCGSLCSTVATRSPQSIIKIVTEPPLSAVQARRQALMHTDQTAGTEAVSSVCNRVRRVLD